MKREVAANKNSFAIPIEGLSIARSFRVGCVEILPSAKELPFLEEVDWNEDFGARIKRDDDQHRAIAVVHSTSIDGALGILEEAINVLRVFQFGMTNFRHYTHFGLPGEIRPSKIFFFEYGEKAKGPKFKSLGLHLGFNFREEAINRWENMSTGLQLAADAIDNPSATEGSRKALLGVLLFSQSILTRDPDLRVLLVIAALEGMLAPEKIGSYKYTMARQLTYLACWTSGGCRNIQGKPCAVLMLDPSKPKIPELLGKLKYLADSDTKWRCSYWTDLIDWYDIRSGIAHGRPEGIEQREAEDLSFRSYRDYLAPLLKWFAEHPKNPLSDLEAEISDLRAEGIDWGEAVKLKIMPPSEA